VNTYSHFVTIIRATFVSQQPQSRSGGSCWNKVLRLTCPCWRQPAHLDYEDARLLLSSITYIICLPSAQN